MIEECERITKAKVDSGKRPKAFVFENVRGILSSKMPDGTTTVPQEILRRMEALGYDVSMKLVCSSDYGVPQQRYRVLIVGVDKETFGNNPFDFKTLDNVVTENHIPSTLTGNDDELLLGYILKDVHTQKDDIIWPYSTTTQKIVELIGSCEHGEKAMDLFYKGYSKQDLPPIVFKGR